MGSPFIRQERELKFFHYSGNSDNISSHLLNKAMMLFGFGDVVKPDKQNFSLVSVFAVSCGIVLFLYLVQGILCGVIPLELNNHDREIRSGFWHKHQIRKSLPVLPDLLFFASAAFSLPFSLILTMGFLHVNSASSLLPAFSDFCRRRISVIPEGLDPASIFRSPIAS